MTDESLAGRCYPRVYSVSGRGPLHDFISSAVEASGGKVIYASPHTRAPFYFGVQTDRGERLGLLIYAFTVTKNRIKGRPEDEIRGQIRYGSEESWLEEHPIGIDIAGVDTTLVLGVNPVDGYFIALDPQLWSPLPMGISFYAKEEDINAMGGEGWSVWEKDNHDGVQRGSRSDSGLETVVAFSPERILDYARFERQAIDLTLDTPLRFALAVDLASAVGAARLSDPHVLEEQFGLASSEILEIIATRTRLVVAVRGGVAEFHLEKLLSSDPTIDTVLGLDVDAKHDFDVVMRSGRPLRVECKNASPKRYADGAFRVEVQKTRASQNDPASRFYRMDAFDVVAACLFSPTGEWTFRFALTRDLARHKDFPDRLAPMQRVDGSWVDRLADLPPT